MVSPAGNWERSQERTDPMTVQELQRQLAPKDDLTPYAGEWVALRDGRVIAHDIDPVAVRNHPEVSDTDAIIPVAETGDDLLLL